MTCLAKADILSTASLSTIHANQALEDRGIAELLQSSFQGLQGAVDTAPEPSSLSHAKVKFMLSLAWPCYLRELAASKSPITQVRCLALSPSFSGT